MDKKDIALVDRCKYGDVNAREWLYKTHSPWMLGICLRYFSDRMVAEDVVHDSFLTIFEKIGGLKDTGALEAWMKRIVVNNCLIALKKQPSPIHIDEINEAEIEPSVTDEPQNIKEKVLQSDIAPEVILSIVNELPTGYKTVFNLYVFEKYNHSQIAAELGISEGTSKSQLMRARKIIQQKICNWMDENERKNEKKKVVVYSMFLLMNDNNLDYIDQLVFDKLSHFNPTMVTKHPPFDVANSTIVPNSHGAALKGFISTGTGKLVLIGLTTIIGALTVYLLIKPTRNFYEPNAKQPSFIVDTLSDSDEGKDTILVTSNRADTVVSAKDKHQSELKKANEKQKIIPQIENKTVYDTIKVKKVVRVKKKKVVTRTINKSDTLP